MPNRHPVLKFIGIVIAIIYIVLFSDLVLNGRVLSRKTEFAKKSINEDIFKKLTSILPWNIRKKAENVFINTGFLPIPSPTPTIIPTPTIVPNSVSFIEQPKDIIEEQSTTFTWYVDGSPNIITDTTVYFGTTSNPGVLTNNASPQDTSYTGALKDFMNGKYTIPLRFIASRQFLTPATYYYRGYALVDGKHIWSDEHTLNVTGPPHSVKIVDKPGTVKVGESANFTWEVSGPPLTTNYSAIVYSKESKPGELRISTGITSTPYTTLVKDFTTGTYNVPLRFIGSAQLTEPGTYYFRGLTVVDNRNIWTEESSFKVE